MHRLQELVRLHRLGVTERRAAKELRMGRNTAREYRRAIAAAGLLDGSAEELPSLETLKGVVIAGVPARPAPQQISTLESWQAHVEALLEKRLGPQAIHDRLRLEHEDFQGSLGSLKRLVRRIRLERGARPEDVAIPVDTEPGEVAQVDFGYAGQLWDATTGKPRKAWVFVMVLGHSRHQYAEVVFDQRTATWLELHQRAFAWFGGVPKVIVPDNLKAAVIRAAFGVSSLPELNRSYRELARHHGFRVDPTPPRAPKKKGKVESSVKYVKYNFLRGRQHQELGDLNRELLRWVQDIAGVRVHGTTGQRPLEVFTNEERSHLLPIPTKRYDAVVWKKARVHEDSHVHFERSAVLRPVAVDQPGSLGPRHLEHGCDLLHRRRAGRNAHSTRPCATEHSGGALAGGTSRSSTPESELLGEPRRPDRQRRRPLRAGSFRLGRRLAAAPRSASNRDVSREVSRRARECSGAPSKPLRELQLPGDQEHPSASPRPRAVAHGTWEARLGRKPAVCTGHHGARGWQP